MNAAMNWGLQMLPYDPNLLIVVGDPGVGKTTLLNGMAGYGGETGLNWAGVTAWEDVSVRQGPELPNGKRLQVLDTPGLGGPKGKLSTWVEGMIIHLGKNAKHTAGIVVLVDGTQSRITMSGHIMSQIVPAIINVDANPWDRIVFVVSKCNLPESAYKKMGQDAVARELYSALQQIGTPQLDKFDRQRDIIFVGDAATAPRYDRLLHRLNEMSGDKRMPTIVNPSAIKPIVVDALRDVVGPEIDGLPIQGVVDDIVQDALRAMTDDCCCPGCSRACSIQ